MILFASGRTDIPAFYSQWFLNRIHAGFVDVRNPYYGEQVTRYKLTPDLVDCIVFCTKNPAPLIPHLKELNDFGTYYFVTITPYGKEIEPHVPDKEEIINSVHELSECVGKEKICWRYDPIFVDKTYTAAAHIRSFRTIAEKLRGATDRCVISFIDLYEKTKRNFPSVKEVSVSDQKFLAQALSVIARDNGMTIESCAEKTDLSAYGVETGCCISKKIIESASGLKLLDVHGHSIRPQCACLPTHDIASYNTCPHGCKYCYANYDSAAVAKNVKFHDDNSSFLIGGPKDSDILKEAKQKSWRDTQLVLL